MIVPPQVYDHLKYDCLWNEVVIDYAYEKFQNMIAIIYADRNLKLKHRYIINKPDSRDELVIELNMHGYNVVELEYLENKLPECNRS